MCVIRWQGVIRCGGGRTTYLPNRPQSPANSTVPGNQLTDPTNPTENQPQVEMDFAPLAAAAAMLYGSAFVADRYAGIRGFLEAGGKPTTGAYLLSVCSQWYR